MYPSTSQVKTKLISVSFFAPFCPSSRYDKTVPFGPNQWLFLGIVMISASSGMSLKAEVGKVTRYAICPVGIGGDGCPWTMVRAIECRPSEATIRSPVKVLLPFVVMVPEEGSMVRTRWSRYMTQPRS